MVYRTRIKYSEAQLSDIWDRWQRGETLNAIGRVFDRPSSSIYNLLAPTGGIRPKSRKRSRLALTLSEREEISRGIVAAQSIRRIAANLNRSPSTISREIARNGGFETYRATQADQAAWGRARRPKICKLALQPPLRRLVAKKLKQNWSPKQIAGWLKQNNPSADHKQVSHETIYRSLFIQARGVLKKELQQYLRTQRAIRRARQHSIKNEGLGKICNAVSIRERPAAIEDRAVPGHWEGDLIAGSNNSYIATLVERHTRYVMLVKIRQKDTETVINALIKHAHKLPTQLYKL
jgi:IS30 family transposase